MAHHVKQHESTYLGRRARVRIEFDRADENAPRTVTTTWIDDATPENGSHPAGTTTRKRITGNVRRGTLEILEAEEVIS